jgi:hypothetical protein
VTGCHDSGLDGLSGDVRELYATGCRIPRDLKLLFAISFGIPDEDSPLQNLNTPRLSLEESVVTHDTPGVLTEQ